MEPPTLALCSCPNGCVVLKFGYVTVHLPRAAFLAFAERVGATVAAIHGGCSAPPVEH